MAGSVTFKIKRIIQATPDIKTLQLVPVVPSSFNFDFKPGQFVNLMIQRPGQPLMARPYSIASSPNNTDYLELTIKIVEGGRFTTIVDSLKEGDEVKISGPFGRFFFLDEQKMKKLVLIGGGCGVTPFISMVRYVIDRNIPINITYIYSCRTPETILYYDELQKIAEEHDNIQVVFTCTREAPPNWKGERGRINSDMIGRNIDVKAPNQYFMLCGPPAMVKDTIEMLKSLRAPEDRIISESWSSG